MLTATASSISQKLELIDTIQRLGFAYHFESEISEFLGQMQKFNPHGLANDLHTVSLWFRLLRQEGSNISSGIYTCSFTL